MPDIKYKFRSRVDHDFETHDVCEGVVDSVETFEDPETKRKSRFMVVSTADALERVYESATLKDAFDVARPGDRIYVRFLRQKPMSGGRSVKLYDVRLWTEK